MSNTKNNVSENVGNLNQEEGEDILLLGNRTTDKAFEYCSSNIMKLFRGGESSILVKRDVKLPRGLNVEAFNFNVVTSFPDSG
jgi:hypothetical protein